MKISIFGDILKEKQKFSNKETQNQKDGVVKLLNLIENMIN